MNPLKHIDPLGFIMLIVAGFGWAKPVQFNEQNLRNPRIDVIKIALAGPLSNAVIAMILTVIITIISSSVPVYHSPGMKILSEVFHYAIFINWGLFIFNLIHLPPLDGSHLLFSQLRRFPSVYDVLYKYGSFLLFGLVIATFLTKKNFLPIGPVIEFFYYGFFSIISGH